MAQNMDHLAGQLAALTMQSEVHLRFSIGLLNALAKMGDDETEKLAKELKKSMADMYKENRSLSRNMTASNNFVAGFNHTTDYLLNIIENM